MGWRWLETRQGKQDTLKRAARRVAGTGQRRLALELLEGRELLTVLAMGERTQVEGQANLETAGIYVGQWELDDRLAEIDLQSHGSEFVVFEVSGMVNPKHAIILGPSGELDPSWTINSTLSPWGRGFLTVAGSTPATPGNVRLRLNLQAEEYDYAHLSVTAWVGLPVLDAASLNGNYQTLEFHQRPPDDAATYRRYVPDLEVASQSELVRFELVLEPGEYWSLGLVGGNANGLLLYDDQGQLMAESKYLGLTNQGTSSQRYYAEFYPTEHLVELNAYRSQNFEPYSWYADVYIRDNTLVIGSGSTFDLRTCSLEDFRWDGPELTDMQASGSTIELTMNGPLEERMYHLLLKEGSCATLDGSFRNSELLPVDYVRPSIVEFPIRDKGWILPGHDVITITFDEQLGGIWGNPEGWATLKSKTPGIAEQSANLGYIYLSHGVAITLGNLPEGGYELTIHDLEVRDTSSNRYELRNYTIPFVVSSRFEDQAVRWDFDGNSVVNQRDFETLQAAIWSSQSPTYDLNGDGQNDELDLHVFIRKSKVFLPGDTNLDGVFDKWDLESLSYSILNEPANWYSGDFDGDGLYTTTDLILALQGGVQGLV